MKGNIVGVMLGVLLGAIVYHQTGPIGADAQTYGRPANGFKKRNEIDKQSKNTSAGSSAEVGSVSHDCANLVRYRDNELFQEWNTSMSRHTAAREAKELLARELEKMGDESWWEKSDGPTVAASVKLVTNAVSNILGLTPTGGIVSAARRLGQRPHRNSVAVYQALKTGKSIKTLVEEESEIAAAKILLGQAGPLGAATRLVWDAIQDAITLQEAQDTKKALLTSLQRLKDEIERYEKVAEDSLSHADALDAVRSGIDQYCSANTTEQGTAKLQFDLSGTWRCNVEKTYATGRACTAGLTSTITQAKGGFQWRDQGTQTCRGGDKKAAASNVSGSSLFEPTGSNSLKVDHTSGAKWNIAVSSFTGTEMVLNGTCENCPTLRTVLWECTRQ